MIFVTSGFEQGVGLEVFLKAILNLDNPNCNSFHLITSKEHLAETIRQCDINIKINSDEIRLSSGIVKTTFLAHKDSLPLTTRTLEYALEKISATDILLTLPTRKDQLILDNNIKAGYTEYFREKFTNSNLAMSFISNTDNVMLLTDHIPLSKVEGTITRDLILRKVETTLESFPKSRDIKDIYFSGINPHCGEDGLMGSTDEILKATVVELQEKFSNYKFHLPKAGDTLYFNHSNNSQLFIFAFHDQGLAPFKLKNGLIGINLTLGLPFKRVSVDHGTAPDIYGKNCADYGGMSYLLKEVQSW